MSRSILDGSRDRRSLGRLSLALLVVGGLVAVPPIHRGHAATPQGSSSLGGGEVSTLMTIRFAPGSAALPAALEPTLSRIAAGLLAAPSVRVALVGYPDGTQDFLESDRSHRLSLTRAIALRRRLVEMGVPRVRMIVRLVALNDGGGRSDRVDIVKMSGDG